MTTADRYALRGFPPRTLTDRSAEQKKPVRWASLKSSSYNDAWLKPLGKI